MRRGAFKWLPVLCSNDLEHGSWWMVVGSFFCTIFAIVPLTSDYVAFYESMQDDILPAVDFLLTWLFLIFSGVFFTLGSLAFVRAFAEPPKKALFSGFKHLQTDELLGAWCFLIGTVPAIPYTLVFFLIEPNVTYVLALIMSLVMVVGTLLFVLACYPTQTQRKTENYILPCFLRTFGARIWVVKHLANDWLAGTWFFLIANFVYAAVSIFFLIVALATQAGGETLFIWVSSVVTALLFLAGSLYFVAGSYPHAQQFYYVINRGKGAERERSDHGKRERDRQAAAAAACSAPGASAAYVVRSETSNPLSAHMMGPMQPQPHADSDAAIQTQPNRASDENQMSSLVEGIVRGRNGEESAVALLPAYKLEEDDVRSPMHDALLSGAAGVAVDGSQGAITQVTQPQPLAGSLPKHSTFTAPTSPLTQPPLSPEQGVHAFTAKAAGAGGSDTASPPPRSPSKAAKLPRPFPYTLPAMPSIPIPIIGRGLGLLGTDNAGEACPHVGAQADAHVDGVDGGVIEMGSNGQIIRPYPCPDPRSPSIPSMGSGSLSLVSSPARTPSHLSYLQGDGIDVSGKVAVVPSSSKPAACMRDDLSKAVITRLTSSSVHLEPRLLDIDDDENQDDDGERRVSSNV
jgi:hypothetical protein